jgi:NADH-quinone oxidoreductase subunit H
LGQPLADGMKFLTKEEYTPAHVNRRLYVLAPIVILSSALAAFAVIPFGSVLPVDLTQIPLVNQLPLESWGVAEPITISLVAAPDLNVGVIYAFALSSIAVYGVILGGWASNNKYGFIGGLRSSAQLIAYELPLGLGILGVVLAAGSLRFDTIITGQAETGVWNVIAQPLGCVVFVIAAFAEAARAPFDLPEAEQELVGGYHTEYSGVKLLFFLTAEFIHMITASILIVVMFFGGWHLWGVTGAGDDIGLGMALLRIAILAGKVFLVVLFFMLVRWSWPRFRFDQLMALAWKVMLPLGMVNLIAVAVSAEYGHLVGVGGVIAIGWVVALVAWLGIAATSPLVTDNRPRVTGES